MSPVPSESVPNGQLSASGGDHTVIRKVVVLCGGVGGSKLVLGLHHEFPDDDITIIVNTGDDLDVLGLHVSPDLDTVMYTLAGLSNPTTGWGLQADAFGALDMLERYGHDTWFRIGDRDLATHLIRTQLLQQGRTLSEATAILADQLQVSRAIVPMTNDPVATIVRTSEGWLSFQEYFVKRRYADIPLEVKHEGISAARLSTQIQTALESADLIIAAPSNPVVSIGPILEVPGLRRCLEAATISKIAVSPFVGERSVTGPADVLMRAAGSESNSVGLASLYSSWLDVLVIDEADATMIPQVEAAGVRAVTTTTLMPDLQAKRRLARFTVDAAR